MITDMTLEEAMNLQKWRPGVHYAEQAEVRMELMKAEIERLRASSAEAVYIAERRGVEAALNHFYPAVGFDRGPIRMAIRAKLGSLAARPEASEGVAAIERELCAELFGDSPDSRVLQHRVERLIVYREAIREDERRQCAKRAVDALEPVEDESIGARITVAALRAAILAGAAPAPEQGEDKSTEAALREALDDCVAAYYLPGDHCEMEQSIERARALLSRQSAKRKPEAGDVWLIVSPTDDDYMVEQLWSAEEIKKWRSAGWSMTVLMTRAEVEARVKEGK